MSGLLFASLSALPRYSSSTRERRIELASGPEAEPTLDCKGLRKASINIQWYLVRISALANRESGTVLTTVRISWMRRSVGMNRDLLST